MRGKSFIVDNVKYDDYSKVLIQFARKVYVLYIKRNLKIIIKK